MNEQRDRLKELLQAADRVPPAPDCRDAVMAGISERRRWLRPVWVYACAALLIAIGIGTAFFVRTPGAPPRATVIVKAPPPRRPPPPQHRIAPRQQEDTERVAVQQHSEPAHQRNRAARKRTLIVDVHRSERSEHSLEPAPAMRESPAPTVTAQKPPAVAQEKPVAIVFVTFPSGETKADVSYEVTTRDVETGEVTECSVNRTGNLLDMHLESTKGEEEKPPVKGCVDHENKSNA